MKSIGKEEEKVENETLFELRLNGNRISKASQGVDEEEVANSKFHSVAKNG